jgi:hypothetical protein
MGQDTKFLVKTHDVWAAPVTQQPADDVRNDRARGLAKNSAGLQQRTESALEWRGMRDGENSRRARTVK